MNKNWETSVSKEPHIVPLTPFHLELLNDIKAYSERSIYLFLHQDGGKPKTCDALAQAVHRFCTPQEKVSEHSLKNLLLKIYEELGRHLLAVLGLTLRREIKYKVMPCKMLAQFIMIGMTILKKKEWAWNSGQIG